MALRVGVVGVGNMGRNHARVLAELGVLKVVGDADRNVAASVANAFRAEVAADPERALEGLDAVVIATPTATHHDLAAKALEQGVHVLVEKPIAETAEQAKDLVQRARKSGRVLAVGHVERHNPVVKFAKDALGTGQFGNLITAHARRVSNFPGRIRDVGCIKDIGIHDLDVVRYLAGAEAEKVYCAAGTVTPNLGFEDHANILLKFKNGVSGVVEVNWLTPRKTRTLTLTCLKGLVEVDYMEQVATVSSSTFRDVQPGNLWDVPIEVQSQTVRMRREEPLRRELVDFLGACDGQHAPLATGDDGLAAVELAEAALRSAKSGKEVLVEAR